MGCVEFTREELERVVTEHPDSETQRRATAQALAMHVARSHGLTVEEMLGPRRFAHLAVARADLYRALRAKKWSYPAIGRFVGKDHTTIIAALWPEERRAARSLKQKMNWALK